MSTFGRTTRSSNLGKLAGSNVSNLNKPSLVANVNSKNVQQLIGKPQPLKRTALSSTTNLLSKNALANVQNSKVGDLKTKQQQQDNVKVSTTENAFIKPKQINSNVNKAKGLGGVNRSSRIPTRNGQQKLEPIQQQQQQEQQLINTTKQQTQQQSKNLPKQLIKNDNVLRFSSFNIPDNVENIDLHDSNDVLLVNEFSDEIYIYLRHLENSFKLKANYLDIQQHVTSKMRARLIDWIIAVHYKFKLLSETLYLTVAIMDRFLEKVNITKDKVQLVGLTAFFIACKYEEIYPPEITDFIQVCDVYTKDDILKMEKIILRTLDFNLSYPLPLHFLRRFSKAAHADQEIHTLAKYLMELGLLDYKCSSWKPSLMAAASLYLTLQILLNDSEPIWTETLAFYTNYTESELQPYISTLCNILILTKESKLQTVYKKYSSYKMMNISDSPKLKCDYVIEMSDNGL